MYIFVESTTMTTVPQNTSSSKRNGNLRFEACIQTAGDINRNKRRYSRPLLGESVDRIMPRVHDGSFVGEMDHPVDTNPVRQTTCLYKECSHRFVEMGWDGNKLIAVVECLRTPNGNILRNLAEDGIPVGFSFRGMGDLRMVNEGGKQVNEVVGPLHTVTWDAVSYPSHAQATMIKITEGVVRQIHSNVGIGCQSLSESMSCIIHDANNINENDDLICTSEGVCYLPNQFDKLVEQRVITLVSKFEV